jgi:DNA repair protein RadA/Sms
MGRVSRLYVCSTCERPSAQWSGRCASCGGWGTVSEHPAGSARGSGTNGRTVAVPVLSLLIDREEDRIPTGSPGVDRVLGSGLVPGSVVLLAGAPGIGKSTLLLQLASNLVGAGHPCLIASGEESHAQVASRARRLGLSVDGVGFAPGRDLHQVVATALVERPTVLVVDSIHTVRDPESDAMPGGVGQVRNCADALVALAKEHGITVVLVGHVTKDGDLAGPRTLEHAVDTVLSFDGDPRSGRRVLSAGKNRFGPEGELAWFEMGPHGLREVQPGPRLGDQDEEVGCATALALAGRRAFAVDVQALVVPTEGPPRRHVAGLDSRRFGIVVAVTDQASSVRLARSEVYGASVGGVRLEDPGADLALAAALASAGTGVAPPPRTAFVGEIALTGSVRPVPGLDQRLSAARAAGMERVVFPRAASAQVRPVDGVRMVPVGHVREALSWTVREASDRASR